MKSKAILMLTFLMFLTASLMFAESAVTKKTIKLPEPATVGNVTLQPGDYRLQWQGTGPDVQVSFVPLGFMRAKNAVATVPATLQRKKTSHAGAVAFAPQSSGAKALVEIDWENEVLTFAQPGGAGASK